MADNPSNHTIYVDLSQDVMSLIKLWANNMGITKEDAFKEIFLTCLIMV